MDIRRELSYCGGGLSYCGGGLSYCGGGLSYLRRGIISENTRERSLKAKFC